MSDVWSDFLLTCSFGGIELTVVTGRDSMARALVRHSVPRRDGARLVDMGGEARETRCTIVFCEEKSKDDDHIVRLRSFLEKATSGERAEFIHPITGSYRAYVEGIDFDWNADDRDFVTVECTFVEDILDELLPPDLTSRMPSLSALLDVEITSAELNAAFAAALIDSSLGLDALDMVLGWDSNPLLTVREINTQLEAFSGRLANAESSFLLAADLSLYPVLKMMNLLAASVRKAAAYFKQNEPSLIEVRVVADTPLLVFVTDLYGAEEASDRYVEALRLNDIDDPILLNAGTTLTMPAPGARERQQLQGAA